MLRVHAVCMCALLFYLCCVSTINVRVCVCVSVYTCERWCFHRNVRIEDLLDSGGGRLILHGLSKWREEDKSHYSRYRMYPAVVPSAWIHMSGQTDLSPALSALKKTKTLNTDMYSTFMKTWANSPSEGSVRRSQTWQGKEEKKRKNTTSGLLLLSQYNAVHVSRRSGKYAHYNGRVIFFFWCTFRPLICCLTVVWHLKINTVLHNTS